VIFPATTIEFVHAAPMAKKLGLQGGI
jgi:hypothetical protein